MRSNFVSDSSPTDNALNQQYTVKRKLEVRQVSTNEKRVVTQYHYQKWPDFGVPEGNEVNSFLKLVSLVAQEYPSTEGKLWLISQISDLYLKQKNIRYFNPIYHSYFTEIYIPERPNIIHCSAGVGRSGTFCLVDSCLERMAKSGIQITQEQVGCHSSVMKIFPF